MAMLIAIFLGTLIGVLAGYFRRLDGPLMRLTDMFLALPLMPLLLVMVMLFRDRIAGSLRAGAGGIHADRLCHRDDQLDAGRADRAGRGAGAEGTGISCWPPGPSARHRAGSSCGTSCPTSCRPVMVAATLGMAEAIITESVLSFLGLGFPPDFPTWGRLLFDGVEYMQHVSRAGDLAGPCDFADRAERELHRRRFARRAGPAHPGAVTRHASGARQLASAPGWQWRESMHGCGCGAPSARQPTRRPASGSPSACRGTDAPDRPAAQADRPPGSPRNS